MERKYETALIYLEQVPKINIETSFDWPTFWSFCATVAVFVLGTAVTVYNFRKTVKQQKENAKDSIEQQNRLIDSQQLASSQSLDQQIRQIDNQQTAAAQSIELQREMIESQELVARLNSLKASRQNWINDLRDASSQFVASALNVSNLISVKRQFGSYWAELEKCDPVEHARVRAVWAVDHNEAVKEVRRLSAKIELLLNPKEEESKSLLESIRDMEFKCGQESLEAEPGVMVDSSPKDLDEPSRELIQRCQVILKNEWEKAKAGL